MIRQHTKGRIAVVGATGIVGETLLSLLAERGVSAKRVVALASAQSLGAEVQYGRASLDVEVLDDFDFSDCQLALFSAGAAVSAEHAPRALSAGCTVIDNTSQFRLDPKVPLVVPEVNGQVLDEITHPALIANPNCSTIQMLVALAPIHARYGIERINVATYQSVSGAGKAAMEELGRQALARFSFQTVEPKAFTQPIAFNVIAQIDAFERNGYTREEMKLHNETRRILGECVAVNATAVRVPVFVGHAEAVHVETATDFELEAVRALLAEAPGVRLTAADQVASPLVDAADDDRVHVSRLRRDLTHPRGLNLWVVADNVRKGAALNAVQIAERLFGALDGQ